MGDSKQKWKTARKSTKSPKGGGDEFEARSTGSIKKTVRDLERLLQRVDHLPADVRVEKERALQSHKLELAEAQAAQQRKAMISRYHMVRFFGIVSHV